MTPIAAIILIPTNPEMLAEGPCGARPPGAWLLGAKTDTPRWIAWKSHTEWQRNGGAFCARGDDPAVPLPPDALVLAWNGEPVVEGMDRATRLHRGRPWTGHTMQGVLDLVERVFPKFGTLILLDHSGNEVTP